MEPVTHALSGAVLAATLPGKVSSRWLPIWGALVAASPDIDVFFIHTPLEYIEYHRGITHSFPGAVFLALIWAGIFFFIRQRMAWRESLPQWSFFRIWGASYLLLLLHIWLDCMNSYGTQIFLPFSTYRVRWNALFIVDPLLLIPLGIGVVLFPLWKKRGLTRQVMAGLLIWTILYPLGALAIRIGTEASLNKQIQTPNAFHLPSSFRQQPAEDLVSGQSGDAIWSDVQQVHLVPDAFSPFYWKLILDRSSIWDVAGYRLFAPIPTFYTSYAKPPVELWGRLGELDRTFRVYQEFAAFPAWEHFLLIPEQADMPAMQEYVFTDLRFGSTIPEVDSIQLFYKGKRDPFLLPFRIMARLNLAGKLESVRFLTTSGAGGDSGWNPPVVP